MGMIWDQHKYLKYIVCRLVKRNPRIPLRTLKVLIDTIEEEMF